MNTHPLPRQILPSLLAKRVFAPPLSTPVEVLLSFSLSLPTPLSFTHSCFHFTFPFFITLNSLSYQLNSFSLPHLPENNILTPSSSSSSPFSSPSLYRCKVSRICRASWADFSHRTANCRRSFPLSKHPLSRIPNAWLTSEPRWVQEGRR